MNATHHTIHGDKAIWETRRYIIDLPPNAKPLADAIRKHREIENGQHCVSDETFGKMLLANKTTTALPSLRQSHA